MQNFKFTTIGAVFAGVLASLCCIGPLAVAALGATALGSAGLFTLFEPYRPYLIGLVALLLGLGFYATYRRPAQACKESEACASPRTLKMRKIGLWAMTGLIGLMLAIPYLPFSGTSSVPTAGATETAMFTVEGMDCAACASGIAASLTRQEGIAKAEVDFEGGTAKVTYTPASITSERIAELITEQGFAATVAGKPTSQADTEADTSLATTVLKVEGMT